MSSINQRIKQVRKTLNMSQVRFGEAISFSGGHIAGVELGHREVNDRIIKSICTTFDVNETWLRTGDGAMFKTDTNLLLKSATVMLRQLDPTFQEYVSKQIHLLLDIQNNKRMSQEKS